MPCTHHTKHNGQVLQSIYPFKHGKLHDTKRQIELKGGFYVANHETRWQFDEQIPIEENNLR